MAGDAAKERYGQAYIAQGNGDLVSVTDFTANYTNNASQVDTLRVKAAGYTPGIDTAIVSFNFVVGGTTGFERNFLRQCQRMEIVSLRVKLPDGRTLSYDGVYQNVDLNCPLDAAVTGSITFIGKLEAQAALAA